MDDKLINFLLVLVTGRVWSQDSNMFKWMSEDSYFKLDLWQDKKCMEIIGTILLPSAFKPTIRKKQGYWK